VVGVIARVVFAHIQAVQRFRSSSTQWVRWRHGYIVTFFGAALGLFLFYGFEACGNARRGGGRPTRRIPRAMMLTILIGGVSGLLSYVGYVLAAPDLQAIVDGEDPDPIPAILESALGTAGSKVFLCVAVMAFISCVLSLQAREADFSTRLPATACCR
jgi:amino acid transporter